MTDFTGRFGRDFDDAFGAQAAPLLESGLLAQENDRIRLSDRGLELADSVFTEFV